MSERGYSISKDKVSQIYKRLSKKQSESLYIHLTQKENRYKDIYTVNNEERGSIYNLNKLYKQGILSVTEDELYRDLNLVLKNHNNLPVDLVIKGLKDINKLSRYYLKKHEPLIELKVQKGEIVVPTSEWVKIWNRMLKLATKNKGKMEQGATLANLYFDDYVRFGQEGRLYMSKTQIGQYEVKPTRYKDSIVCVLTISIGGEVNNILLGFDKQGRDRDREQIQAIKSLITLTDNTKGISLEDLKLYSEDYFEGLELSYLTDEDGDIYFDTAQVILNYLNETIREYGVKGSEQYIRNLKITDSQIFYKKQPIADYEITTELDDSKYPLSFYEVTMHIEFINSDATHCTIGYYEYTESEELASASLLLEDDDLFEGLHEGFGEESDEWDDYDDMGSYDDDYTYSEDYA